VPTYGVDFFRVDRSGSTKRLLVVAVTMVTLGASSVGAHLVARIDATVGHAISLGGGVMLLAGLVLGFGAMAMMLFENVYLVIEEPALLLHDNGKETRLPWSELGTIDVDGGFVVLRRKNGDAVRWFAGKGAAELRGKIDDARRKAIHGLLKTGS
jgi:hypothetical protein